VDFELDCLNFGTSEILAMQITLSKSWRARFHPCVFSELELAEIKARAASDENEGGEPNPVASVDTVLDLTASALPLADLNASTTTTTVERDDIIEPPSLDESLELLKCEILEKCELLNGKPKERLPSLQSAPRKKLNKLVSDVNKVLCHIRSSNVSELHHLLYCAASVVVKHSGYKSKPMSNGEQPQWKTRLLTKIKSLQSDLSQLHSLKDKRMRCGRTIARLNWKYNNSE